ncbi:MAG: DUF5119 domain-containing protein [Muribaculaceae bacterium]
MKRFFITAIIVAALQILSSCEHKELCEDHEHVTFSRVRIDVDWAKFMPKETPSGMTVTMYPADNSREPVSTLTNNISHAVLNLPVGEYSLLVYNQSPSEFGSLRFVGMDHFSTSRIMGNEIQSRWYQSRDDDEIVIAEPEWVGIDTQSGLCVTTEMVARTNAMLSQSRYGSRDGDVVLTTAHPENIISTLTVHVHIKGIYNMRSARASVTGMAAGYMLGENHPTADKATHLLEQWSLTTDSSDPTQGVITAKITTFGLPFGHQGLPQENYLNLSLLLVDGATIIDFPFAIGDQFRYEMDAEANLELSLVLDITIDDPLPDVEPSGGGSGGFDAKVDDWGDEEQVDIGM